ncbi:MAG: hypothetical protein JNK04_02415 [Myxococcales bacterium]|nr:hypothetical protein [Myxococcales bacterium]
MTTHPADAPSAERVAPEPTPPATEEAAAPAPLGAPGALADQGALDHLPQNGEQLAALCSRGHADPITTKICAGKRIGSLDDLLDVLGLAFRSPVGNGELGNPSFALLGHSTSLAARHVSPINPRVFIFTSPKTEGPIGNKAEPDPDFIALAFARGEPLVELVARDARTQKLRFFLLRFELPCEDGGCRDRDLYTGAVERGWVGTSLYDDDDLRNTIFDCNTCHQPGGPDAPKMLRMIEQRPPWTHFFRDNDQGKLLIADYFKAHDKNETYGGIPGRLITWSEPARLEGLVEHEGFREQPLELPTRDLARRVMRGENPADLPGYVALFERARSGQSLPVPFPDYTFVDPDELGRAALAYRKLALLGGLSTAPRPDADRPRSAPQDATTQGAPPPLVRKLEKADEEGLGLDRLHSDAAKTRVGLAPEPGAQGEAILLAMCSRCHNAVLDQRVSRARFDAGKIAALDADQRRALVERLRLPSTSPLKMPPPRFGALSNEEIERVADALAAPAE